MRKCTLAAVLLAAVSIASADVIVSGDYGPGDTEAWVDQGNIRFSQLDTVGQTYTWTQAGTLTVDRDNKSQLKAKDKKGGSDYTLIWQNTGTTTLGADTTAGDGGSRFELQFDINTTINNSGTLAFDATGLNSYVYMYTSTTGVVDNSGLLKKIGGNEGALTNGPGTFVNTGTIRIEEGLFGILNDGISYEDSGEWELVVDNGGVDSELVVLSTSSVLAGDITINLEDGDGGSFAQGEYLVASIANLDMAGYSFLAGSNVASTRTEADGDDTLVYATAIPEPATMSLLALGGLAVLRRRRRTA